MRLLSRRRPGVTVFARRSALCVAAAVLGLAAGACANDEAPSNTSVPGSTTRVDNGDADVLDLRGEPYRASAMAGSGAVVGRITLDGAGAADSSVARTAESEPCVEPGNGAAVPASVGGVAHAVVWIADARTGKPMPIEKRHEMGADGCTLQPRVQAAVVGSTINVFNDDRDLHRLVFVRRGTHDTLTTMPFFNSGQVVASERLAAKPGVVEVRCANHRWMTAHLAVFEHPYFSVTGADGRFRIDSLPPGNYRLMVWRPGLDKPVERRVLVAAGGEVTAEVAVGR